jgi:phytanoyl-CoA hydroxylase
MLTSAQLEQFREHGFVAVPNFFTDREVTSMQAEIERLKNDGRLRNVATEGDGATPSTNSVNLQLCPMYKDSDLFRALPFHPKVGSAVDSLIGDPIILHLDQIFLKPGGQGMGTHWHQDNAYFKIANPLKGTAMWIAIHDATVANGTIRVDDGSFREAYDHYRDPFSDHHIRCDPPEERAVTVELAAGGVLFFCYGTAHSTGDNRTTRERAGVAFHFLHVDFASAGLLAEDRDCRPYLSGPKATGGEREYGVRIEGSWEDEVERALSVVS